MNHSRVDFVPGKNISRELVPRARATWLRAPLARRISVCRRSVCIAILHDIHIVWREGCASSPATVGFRRWRLKVRLGRSLFLTRLTSHSRSRKQECHSVSMVNRCCASALKDSADSMNHVCSALWYASTSWSLMAWNWEDRAWLISPMKHSRIAQLDNVDRGGSEFVG